MINLIYRLLFTIYWLIDPIDVDIVVFASNNILAVVTVEDNHSN